MDIQRKMNMLVSLLVSAALVALLGGLLWMAAQVPWLSVGGVTLCVWIGLAGLINQQIHAAQLREARQVLMQQQASQQREAPTAEAQPPPTQRRSTRPPRKRGPPPGTFPQPTGKPARN